MTRKVAVTAVALAAVLVWLAPGRGESQRQFNPPFALPAGVTLQEDIVFSQPAGHKLRIDLVTPEGGEGLDALGEPRQFRLL